MRKEVGHSEYWFQLLPRLHSLASGSRDESAIPSARLSIQTILPFLGNDEKIQDLSPFLLFILGAKHRLLSLSYPRQ
jgi:hypothetical protein